MDLDVAANQSATRIFSERLHEAEKILIERTKERDEARAKAIDECAAAADKMAWDWDDTRLVKHSREKAIAGEEVAFAIRSLAREDTP